MIKKSLVCLTICTWLLMALPMMAGAATVNTTVTMSVSAIDQVGANGSVNWDQGVVEAVGTGIPSSVAKSPAQARLIARRVAIADAQHNLLETIKSIHVTSDLTMKNFQSTNDTVKSQVSNIISGAKIVNEQLLPDGNYQVTLRINVFGQGSLSEIITDASKPTTPAPLPSPAYNPAALPIYTGLVVDVTGLPLVRAMSPVIFDDTGRAIYGQINIISEYAVSRGIIDYLCTPEDIRALVLGQSRAGATPIMVKAIGLRDNNVNIIIRQADADTILAANAQSNFLPKSTVCVRQ